MSLKERVAREFTTYSWVLIPIAVGINIVGSLINSALKLPLYLDTIGTLLGGILVGPIVGASVGLLTNLLKAIIVNPVALAFAIVNVIIGLLAGFLAIKGFFKSIPKVIISAVIIALVASLCSSPIAVYLFGGITGTGKDAITAFFLATGNKIFNAVFSANVIADMSDKILSCLIVFFLMKILPKRYVENLRSYEA